MLGDDTQASAVRCPRCESIVDPEATQCPTCGDCFPAMRYRRGDPAGGALCGAVRGLALVSLSATVIAGYNLVSPPLTLGKVLFLGTCLGCLVLFFRLSTRLHRSTYHVE